MKSQDETLSAKGLSRRQAIKFAGAGIAAGVVGSASLAGAIQENMLNTTATKDINILVHFADTDYTESIIKNADIFKGLNADLLMRSYTYIDYGKIVSRTFRTVHPHTEISKVLGKSRIVVSTCSLTLMEAQKAGATPIYLNDGKVSELTLAVLGAQGIDVIDLTDRKGLVRSLRISLRQKGPLVRA